MWWCVALLVWIPAHHCETCCTTIQGAFAKVYRAKCLTNGQDVAIKVLKLEKIHLTIDDIRVCTHAHEWHLYTHHSVSRFFVSLVVAQAEVQTMRLCNHPNVLSCLSCFVSGGDELWLVMPYMDKGVHAQPACTR